MEGRRGRGKKANLFADEKWSSCRDRPRLWIRICCKLLLHDDLSAPLILRLLNK